MKYFSFLFIFLLSSLSSFSQSGLTFHSYKGVSIFGDTIDFSKYEGMKLMIVNTASFCGFTPQYHNLEQMYAQYGDSFHFAILGFPSDDFNQETGNDSTINEFCQGTYSVTFQMMSKTNVIKGDTEPIYKWLERKNLNGVKDTGVIWNFNKFLIDEAGRWIAYYPQDTIPNTPTIVKWITTPSIYTSVQDVNSPVLQLTSANPVSTELSFNLINTSPQYISAKLYSLNGVEVADVYKGNASKLQGVSFNTSAISSGIYFMRVETSSIVKTVKVEVVH